MRNLVVERLRVRWPSARIIHELPLRYSRNRLDLAAVTHDEIVGVEIKSSRDVSDRLEAQLRAFAPVCTRLIVALAPQWNEEPKVELTPLVRRGKVVGQRWAERRTEAQRIIAAIDMAEMETWTVCAETGRVETTMGGYSHFRQQAIWPAKLLDMLHVAELAAIAVEHRIGGNDTHERLRQICTEHLSTRKARRAACRALRARAAFAAGTDPPIAPPRAR